MEYIRVSPNINWRWLNAFCVVLWEICAFWNSAECCSLNFLFWETELKRTENLKLHVLRIRNFFQGQFFLSFLHLFKQIPFSNDLCCIHNLLHAPNCLKMGFWKYTTSGQLSASKITSSITPYFQLYSPYSEFFNLSVIHQCCPV